ncbi:MAG: hypothetical protein FWC41_04220 [Firmicutes bacterium]|nr:hypothetical protein [Bacillota bacterium]
MSYLISFIFLNNKYAEERIKNVRKSGRKSKLSMEKKLLATPFLRNSTEKLGILIL